MSVESTVRGMWSAVSDRDWDRVGTFFADDCIYTDMPAGPAVSARGPVDIVKRLRLALGPLAGYVGHSGMLVDNGEDAMYEHSETWTWDTGDTVLLRFVSVHKVVDDKITLWKDYWDYAAIMNNAPESWLTAVAEGDLSWMYDATGQI